MKQNREQKLISKTIILSFFAILSTLIACSPTTTSNQTNNDAWKAAVKLTPINDINPDAKIVEINLEAVETEIELKPGIKTRMFTYNNLFPGPLIEANVGDTLIVHFTNNLNEATTVHWHGIELPATMDGSNISQAPVAANGGTFTYQFKLLNAATYWYHPHVQTHRQVEKGLYGALIVRDPIEDTALGLPTKELILLLDDIVLDENDQVAPAYPTDPVEYASAQLNGRESINNVLINGKFWPLTLNVKSGEAIRLRLINSANSKFFRLSIPDHITYRIGGDGGLINQSIPANPIPILNSNVVLQKSVQKNSQAKNQAKPQARHLGDLSNLSSDPDPSLGIFLVPGERAEIIFTPQGNAGESIFLEWHDFPRGRHSAQRNTDGSIGIIHDTTIDGGFLPFRILEFKIDENSKTAQTTPLNNYVPPLNLRTTSAIDVTQNNGILPVTFGHSLPDSEGNINFFATMVDGVGKPFDQLQPEDGLQAIVGGTYIWEVTNLTEGDHPFHPHGFTFQHLSTEYIDDENPANNRLELATHIENKDTIRVPGRPGNVRGKSRTVIKLAVKFSDTGREGLIAASGLTPSGGNSGGWIVHCHILEHSNRGMMTFLNLLE